MADSGTPSVRRWQRSWLAIGAVLAMALVPALAAAVALIAIEAMIEGGVALAALAGALIAIRRGRFAANWSEADRVTVELALAFVALALLTWRAGNAAGALSNLYLVAMFYGVLHLDRTRLAVIGLVALVLHGTGLFMFISENHRVSHPVLWTQFGALVLAFAWATYAAGTLQRLRERLAEAHGRLHDLAAEADDRASRDTLTGVSHHRHLMEALEREIARAERVGKPLSVARVDLDWLGSLNQAHGHAAGDIALKRFTLSAASALRDVDVFGRYGGKEFLAIMPDTDLQGALVAAERMHGAVAKEPIPETGGRRNLSCTLGVTQHRVGESGRQLLARAESCLVYAKAAGRGRIHANAE